MGLCADIQLAIMAGICERERGSTVCGWLWSAKCVVFWGTVALHGQHPHYHWAIIVWHCQGCHAEWQLPSAPSAASAITTPIFKLSSL